MRHVSGGALQAVVLWRITCVWVVCGSGGGGRAVLERRGKWKHTWAGTVQVRADTPYHIGIMHTRPRMQQPKTE